MNSGECRCGCRPSAAEANEAIRRFVAGRVLWPPEALAELARLRRIYLEAASRETWTTAA
jgi:hypothetical protein